jgi:hypothetical protein
MIFTSTTQFAVLGLVLILGLCLGLILAPRGTKWRRRFEEERDAHAAYRTDADARLRERESLTTNRDAYVRDLEKARDQLAAENEALVSENAALKGRTV